MIGLFCFIQLGCNKGGFDPANFAINLEYPEQDSKCEEGVEQNGTMVIPFKWKPQGNLTSFILVLNDEQITITDTEVDQEGLYVFDYAVVFNQNYEWKITSQDIESDIRTFRTPTASKNNNNVPLAVKFVSPSFSGSNNSMVVTFNWFGGDSDLDNNLRYDAYLHPNSDISIANNIDSKTNLTSTTTEFTILNFDPNKYYYLLVVAKDDENEAHSILKFSQF